MFLAGLMIGRTPEYLGKKIGPRENFAGLNANTSFYNVGTVIAMMAGRFALVRPGRTETLEMCNSGQNMSALFTIVHALRVNHDCT